jgi:hypothetical protein
MKTTILVALAAMSLGVGSVYAYGRTLGSHPAFIARY